MRKNILIALIFTLLIISLFSHLNMLGLRGEEPRRAMVAIETYENGNFIVPTILGETYYNKPPFYNWVLALFFFIFQSVTEWVVRFPGIISFLGTGLITWAFARKYIGSNAALLAAAFYYTGIELLFYGTINAAEIDLFYTLIVVLQAFIIFHFTHKEKYFTMYLLSYGLTFVGLMVKGLPSLVFQASTIFALLLFLKRWQVLFSWKHFISIFLFFGAVFIYIQAFYNQEDATPFIINQVYQSSDKSFNNSSLAAIIQFLFKFPLIFVKTILPWSPLLIFLFIKKIRSRVFNNKLTQFAALFILVNIPLYWISPAIRPRYIYMFFPFAAIIISAIFMEIRQQSYLKALLQKSGYIFIVLIIAAILTFPFIEKVSQHADRLIPATIVSTIVFASLLFTYHKYRNYRIHTIVLLLIVGRLWMNFMVFPFFHQTSKVKDYYLQIEKIATITNEAPIFWTGDSITLRPSIRLFGKKLAKTAYSIPPELPYSIPYAYYKQTGHLMSYEATPEYGKFYLAGDTLLNSNQKIDTLYQFKEYWYNRNLILFKLKENNYDDTLGGRKIE